MKGKGFSEVAIVALVLIGVLGFMWIQTPQGQNILPIYPTPPTTPPGDLPDDVVDLRDLGAWFVSHTTIHADCLAGGGTWHYEADFVGCEGVGTDDCDGVLAELGASQCIAAGGHWTCNMMDVYCRR